MPNFILNIDVPDIEAGVAFYTAAFDLRVGRRFDSRFVELVGAATNVYLLQKPAGSPIGPAGGDVRRYERHWSPIHPDFVVEDIRPQRRKFSLPERSRRGRLPPLPIARSPCLLIHLATASA